MPVVPFKVCLPLDDGFFVVKVRDTGVNISYEFSNSFLDPGFEFGWFGPIVVVLNSADTRALGVVVSLRDDMLETVFLNLEKGRFSALGLLTLESCKDFEL